MTTINERWTLENEIVTLEDGFKYYWPAGSGALSAHNLREMADYLDELNKDWDTQLNEYFNTNRPGLPAPG